MKCVGNIPQSSCTHTNSKNPLVSNGGSMRFNLNFFLDFITSHPYADEMHYELFIF